MKLLLSPSFVFTTRRASIENENMFTISNEEFKQEN